MRSLGDSTYFLKAAYEPLKEIMGDKDYIFVKDPINGYVIHTDRIDGELLENVDDLLNDGLGSKFKKSHYNHHIGLSWRDVNKYAECTSRSALAAVDVDYKKDLTSDGTWAYPITKMSNGEAAFQTSPIIRFESELPNLTNGHIMFYQSEIESWDIELPNLTNGRYMFADTNLTSWNIELPKLVQGGGMFRGTQISSWDIELPNLETDEGMFSGTKLTSWNIELPKLKSAGAMFADTQISSWNIKLPNLETCDSMFRGTQISNWHIELPKLKNGTRMFWNSQLESWDIELPNLTNGHSMFANVKLTSWNIDLSKLVTGDYMFQTNTLKSFGVELPALSSGNPMFNGTKLDNGSALRVLNSIPAYTSGSHLLTIGIHVDHKNDEEVLEAITNAENKGWTLTVQWNGTPTTSATATYGLRKPPIYVHMNEIEHSDGTKEQILNWGHYVTNPEDYQEFSSLEEAYEHFGLPNDLEKLNNSEQ